MTDEKKYRTEVPNIIDDLGLDPHERALYVHYKRACGGNDCEWVESVRITAQRTKMSVGRASEARKSLVDRGLIRLISKGNDGTAVRIVSIWDLNTLFYQQEYRPDIDGWKVEQLKEWCQGVHNMNTLEQEEAPNSEPEGVGVHNANGSVHNMKAGVHNMNNKKEPIKKEPIKNKRGGDNQKPKKSNAPSHPPAYQKYIEITEYYKTKKHWREKIIQTVGEAPEALQFWGQVVEAWIGCGFFEGNVKGMIECYERHEIPTTRKSGVYSGRKTNQPKNKQPETKLDPANPEHFKQMLKST